MAGFKSSDTLLTDTEITELVTNIKDTFPNDVDLQDMSEIEIFNIFNRADIVLPLSHLDKSVNIEYIKALWCSHIAELSARGKYKGIKRIKNMESEDGEVEFYDSQNSSENSWNWIDQAETTTRGKELLTYFQFDILILGIGGTISCTT